MLKLIKKYNKVLQKQKEYSDEKQLLYKKIVNDMALEFINGDFLFETEWEFSYCWCLTLDQRCVNLVNSRIKKKLSEEVFDFLQKNSINSYYIYMMPPNYYKLSFDSSEELLKCKNRLNLKISDYSALETELRDQCNSIKELELTLSILKNMDNNV